MELPKSDRPAQPGKRCRLKIDIEYLRGMLNITAATPEGSEAVFPLALALTTEGYIYLWSFYSEVVIRELEVTPAA